MVITVIAEPRSGSTNFANWFYSKKNFTVLFEPMTNPNIRWYKGDIPPSEWKYSTEHLFVKETLGNGLHFSALLAISDKVILLHRDNEQEQIDSWLNAKTTGNWDLPWASHSIEDKQEEKLFKEVKRVFKEHYLDKDYFRVSYEELYYGSGFKKVLEYLSIEGLENIGFPYGKKYRVNLETSIKTLL
jgi:hypothetical protein